MGIYDLIFIPPLWKYVMVALAFFGSVLTNYTDHGLYYSKKNNKPDPFDKADLHTVDMIQEGCYYALVILTGLPILLIIGCSMFIRVHGQGLINISLGLPYVDPDEKPSYDLYIGNGKEKRPWLTIPKIIYGRRRIPWSALGFLIMLLHSFLIMLLHSILEKFVISLTT